MRFEASSLLTDKQMLLLALLTTEGELRTSVLAAKMGLSNRRTLQILAWLESRGLVTAHRHHVRQAGANGRHRRKRSWFYVATAQALQLHTQQLQVQRTAGLGRVSIDSSTLPVLQELRESYPVPVLMADLAALLDSQDKAEAVTAQLSAIGWLDTSIEPDGQDRRAIGLRADALASARNAPLLLPMPKQSRPERDCHRYRSDD